ncbi:uncharacterized protein LOC125233539 [Leguminivora glycinivorella]|uniref:uncharacterized protein LOC125233539 n=1 Tax=Leguminivora glycinivorella TaxID=1035111 RepID=UPI00200E1F8C|nr:uncharacterized protein LOC125233539 [Leguminivora glycinivorella]
MASSARASCVELGSRRGAHCRVKVASEPAGCRKGSWATVYISQMKPVVGPRHANTTLIWQKYLEGVKTDANKTDDAASNVPEVPKTPEVPGKKSRRIGRSRRLRQCQGQPLNLLECCNIAWLPDRAIAKCIRKPVNVLKLTCDEARCALKEAGWLEQYGVVKTLALQAFYENLAQRDVDWTDAVRSIKMDCLMTIPRFLGTYMDCVEFDIIYCVMIKMFKYAPVSSWSTADTCLSARQFLASCPLCPDDCYKGSDDSLVADCRACEMV